MLSDGIQASCDIYPERTFLQTLEWPSPRASEIFADLPTRTYTAISGVTELRVVTQGQSM